MTPDNSFQDFAETDSVDIRKAALTRLITLRVIPKQADDSRFNKGFSKWAALGQSNETAPEHRLLAIAELVRIGQVVKKWLPKTLDALLPMFEHPLPLALHLKDADDRLNVARACSMMKAEWLPKYLAQNIAQEDQGEKARAELMSALFVQVNSVSDVLELLEDAFGILNIETESPADSMARRLTRTLTALRPTLVNSLIEAGESPGIRLEKLLRTAFRKHGHPQEDKAKIDLTRETALAVHDLVRTRFSVSTEAEIYSPITYCRSFFKSTIWPKELRNSLELLIQDICEALVMLGRQGIPNQGLLQRIEVLCDHRQNAKAIITSLAENHLELPENIRQWLKSGQLVVISTVSEDLQESLLRASDSTIGFALIEARKILNNNSLTEQVLSSLEIFNPSLVGAMKDYSFVSETLAKQVEDLAKQRSIDLLGSVGEILDYYPKYFDLTTTSTRQRVRVNFPAIIRKKPDGSAGEVVVKGSVE